MEYISGTRPLRKRHQSPSRCGSSKNEQIKKCTGRTYGNGFLNHSFQPFWGIAIASLGKTEREFFNSLSNCCNCYGFEMPDVAALPFPLNVNAAFKAIEEKLNAINEACIIISDKKEKAAIATAKVFDTGHTLYYIPVRPLYHLMQDEQQKPLADVLIAVFNYLYNIAGISYFRKSGYLSNIYETMEDWIDNDDEDEQYRVGQKQEMNLLKTAGDSIFSLINKPFKIEHAKYLLEQYEKSTGFNIEMYDVCDSLLQLSIDYPNRSIKQNLNTIFLGGDGEEYIYIEQYVSFFWSSYDELCECLFDMVNNELNEMSEMEEPMSLQIFDEPCQQRRYDFDFETRLFNGINNLTEQLNFYDEKYNEPVQQHL